MSRDVLLWLLVVGYLVWPGVWLFVKPILMGPTNLFFLDSPMGNAFFDPQLLDFQPAGGRLAKLKRQTTRLLASVIEFGLWPAAGLSGRTLYTVGTGSARQLHPRLGAYAVVSALCGAGLVMIRSWSGPSTAVTIAAVGLLLTMTTRHLLWLISGKEFRRLLKRSLPDPHVTLATLATFDFIAIVAVAMVVRWRPTDGLGIGRALEESRNLLELRHLSNVPERADLSPIVVILALAAAAYWATLARQLIRVMDFRRDPDDRAYVATLCLAEGAVDDARTWLNPVPLSHVSGPVLQARIGLAIAESAIQQALTLSRALASQLTTTEASADEAVVYLTTQVRGPLAADVAWRIVQLASDASISDGAMFVVLRNLRWSHLARDQAWPVNARETGLSPDTYPLGWSWFLSSTASEKEIVDFLDETRPSTTTDVAIHAIARQTSESRFVSAVSADRIESQLKDLLRVLSPMHLERLPMWIRTFLVEATWALEQRGRRFKLSLAHDLRTVRQRLLSLPPASAEAFLDDLDVAERARLHASVTTRDLMFGNAEPW